MTNRDIMFVIKTLVVILTSAYLLDKLLYFGLSRLSDHVYTGQGIGKLNHYLSVKDTTEILIFGSSRANRHFVSEELGNSVYNVGMDGRKIAYPATLVQLLPKDKEQLVIFHIDVSYVFDRDYRAEDLDALNTKYHRDSLVSEMIKHYNQDNPFQNFLWSTDYNGFVVGIVYNYLFPRYNYSEYRGYDRNENSNQQEINFKKLLDKTTFSPCEEDNYEINPIVDTLLRQVVDFCEANNKTLIFVASPVYHDECKRDDKVLERYMENLGVQFYDYTDLLKENNSVSYWKDISHMTDAGAQVFTKQLKLDIESLL